jgi:hypothetical protein
MPRTGCTCAPTHRPPCAWCVARMQHSEAIADAFLAQLRQDFPGEEDEDETTQAKDEAT